MCSPGDGVLCLIGAKWCASTHSGWLLGVDVLTRVASEELQSSEDRRKMRSKDFMALAPSVTL